MAPQINIAYIQQANNARMTPSPTDPNSGVLSMNGAIDTTLYDQVGPCCCGITEVSAGFWVYNVVTETLRAVLLAFCL